MHLMRHKLSGTCSELYRYKHNSVGSSSSYVSSAVCADNKSDAQQENLYGSMAVLLSDSSASGGHLFGWTDSSNSDLLFNSSYTSWRNLKGT